MTFETLSLIAITVFVGTVMVVILAIGKFLDNDH